MIRPERIRQDCNWMVPQTKIMRSQVREILLVGVVGLEARLDVKIRVRFMDYNELVKFLKEHK